MTEEQAHKLAESYLGQPGTITVTSDYAVFVGNDVKFMTEYAKRMKLQLFVIRDEEVKEEPKPKKKKND